jgi:signal transduction histidine kinase
MSPALYITLYVVVILGFFLVSTLVITRRRTLYYRNFATLTFLVGFWQLLQLLSQIFYAQPNIASVLFRFSGFFASLAALSFIHFSYSYAGHRFKNNIYTFLAVAVGLAAIASKSLSGAQITETGIAVKQIDVLYIVLLVFVMLCFIQGLIVILTDFIKSHDKLQRRRDIILLFAIFQAVVEIVLFSFLAPNSLSNQIVIPFACLITILIIAYGMIQYKLFDIRSFVVRAIAYILTFSITALIYLAPVILLSTYLLHASLSIPTIIVLAIVSLIVAVSFHPLRIKFNKATNELFYRDYYEPQDVLDKISSLLVRTVDKEEIRNQSAHILMGSVKPQMLTYALDADKGPDQHLLDRLHRSDMNVIYVDEDSLDNKNPSLLEELRKRDIALAVRLRTKGENIGFLLFGNKQSGSRYTTVDIRLLTAVADELSISLQNALRFEEIKQFNITLTQKIDAATLQLRHANQRLKALDETKDDFISMASHQLRTPLSIIKGYLDMVITGDAGKISDKQKSFLSQALTNSERMVNLVAELLSVSRITSGKFSIETTPVNLANLIDNEVKQLKNLAESHNIELTFHKPEDFPSLLLDEDKTKQVVINFIDNAIYYSKPKGGKIDVQLINNNDVELRVVDNGIGVPEKEKNNLFTKFYRAKNAKNVRPDGTGIGLYLAKFVISEQGGELIFESKEGMGSTFGFSFKKDKIVSNKSVAKNPGA